MSDTRFFDRALVESCAKSYDEIMDGSNDKCRYKVANLMAHGYDILFESEGVLCLYKTGMSAVFIGKTGDTYKCRTGEVIPCL